MQVGPLDKQGVGLQVMERQGNRCSLPESPERDMVQWHTFILASETCVVSDLHDYQIIKLCNFKPLNLW